MNIPPQVLGDPTVRMFGSRDVDSWILPRERAAVQDWIERGWCYWSYPWVTPLVPGDQFHIMRDGPFHITTILAGLWGGNNYINITRAEEVRRRLLGVRANQWKFYDQKILNTRVWPDIRRYSTIHDSHNCHKTRTMGPVTPWPVRREGFLYCGSGPTKVWELLLNDHLHCFNCRVTQCRYWNTKSVPLLVDLTNIKIGCFVKLISSSSALLISWFIQFYSFSSWNFLYCFWTLL